MTTFNEHLQECLKDEEFKNEYDELSNEFKKEQEILDKQK